jgi:hypothetical protein
MKCGRQSIVICDLGNPALVLGDLNAEQEYLLKYFLLVDVESSRHFETSGFGRLDVEGLNFFERSNGRITELFQRSTVLVDLRSTVHNYFGSSSFVPLYFIALTIHQSDKFPK